MSRISKRPWDCHLRIRGALFTVADRHARDTGPAGSSGGLAARERRSSRERPAGNGLGVQAVANVVRRVEVGRWRSG